MTRRVHLLASTDGLSFRVEQVRADHPYAKAWVPEAELTGDAAVDRVARAICRENCAFYGEPPCHETGPWPNKGCDEPGCHALAVAALARLPPPPGGDDEGEGVE